MNVNKIPFSTEKMSAQCKAYLYPPENLTWTESTDEEQSRTRADTVGRPSESTPEMEKQSE